MSNTSLVVSPSNALAQIEYELEQDPRLQSKNTRRGYKTDLIGFETWRSGRPMAKRLVESYAAYLNSTEQAPASVNRALAAIRWWSRRIADMAYESDMAPDERNKIIEYTSRIGLVRDVKGTRSKSGRHIEDSEFSKILRACRDDPNPCGVRDAAVLVLALCTGLRRSELCDLDISSIKPDGLEIIGKGNKYRQVPLNESALVYINQWIEMRGLLPGKLLCPISKSGKVQTGKGVTSDGLARMLEKRYKQSGLDLPITWHDFRRTFAGNLLDAGVDLATVQALMGHSSPATTSGYDRRGARTKQSAVDKINIPL